MLGTVLGTPAFASPEQLRGDDLDVRSDIYSVGATLYYLLTARPPFEQPNLVRLVTQVAQETPAAPRAIRPDLPKELDAIVMRCLAKHPSERVASYDDLRAALEPFSAAAPRPANPGIRFMAGVVDNLLLWIFVIPIAAWFGDPLLPGQREGMLQTSVAAWTLDILYYTLAEGWWGRAVGKQLFGLRVIDEGRQRPGVSRALVRATVWTLPPGLVMFAYGYAMAPFMAALRNTPQGGLLGFGFPVLGFLLIGILFLTARRANGYAGLHDLASGTRVVMKTARDSQPRRAPTTVDRPAPTGTRHVGPYVVLADQPVHGDGVFLGYDDRLRRHVWVRPARADEPPVPVERRALGRSTRLRWLSGRRTEREAWDAFEAVDGAALVSMLEQPQDWSHVRVWLLDLCMEIRAGLADGSLPPLTLDRVWITSGGRARLLDWAAGTTHDDRSGSDEATPDFPAAQKFLYDVVARSLDPAARSGTLHTPLPLGARSFVERLEGSRFASPDALVEEAAALSRDRATIGRGRRIAHLVFCSLPAAMLALFLVTIMLIFTRPLVADPEVGDFAESLQRLDRLNRTPGDPRKDRERRAFELYVAGKHRARVEDPATWSQGALLLRVTPELRRVAERAVASHPPPTPEELRAAEAIVTPALEDARRELERMQSPFGITAMLLLIATGAFVVVAALGLLSAAIFRGGLQFRFFGMAVVTGRGVEVSRLRALARAALAWSPVSIGIVGLVLSPDRALSDMSWMIATASSLVLLLIGAIYAGWHPERGLQDRFAGTRLVPR
jgi:hypothetical protein